ncbi:MAG: GlcNAc-PI de-N-acetylase [Dehalococcoidia bacterium]|nr:GlcNAc-PI de-N-acetylase [Dehalococcoidia bacterium]
MSNQETARKLRILCFGAHPDDNDIQAGGTAALYAQQGHRVKFVSLTNGDAGHYEMGGAELARRRYAETRQAAKVFGLIEYQVLDIHDEELEPTLVNRRRVVEIIRSFQPDLIMTPRPYDYHPDHRYTAELVQDAAYTVTVAGFVALTPHLRLNPTVVFVSDTFQKPIPFQPDVVVAIDDVLATKLYALHCHTSQFYEWLPYNMLETDQVPPPEDDAGRRKYLQERWLARDVRRADLYRDLLKKLYGAERGAQVRYAEAFEVCEYGAPLLEHDIPRLFPFFPTAQERQLRSV